MGDRAFPPIEGAEARTLILGTLPGGASLAARRYYAHPRNAFWPIALASLAGSPLSYSAVQAVPYEERTALLRHAGIAVWDVLAEAVRPGSLDSAIVRASEIPNDIPALLERHPETSTVAFNGKTAERLFARHVSLEPGVRERLEFLAMPSTSPAMARLDLVAKHARWREVFAAPSPAPDRNVTSRHR